MPASVAISAMLELIQRLAEVHLGRRADAVGALPEKDLVHVQREDLLLGELGLHQQRDVDLAHLALHVAPRRQEHVARHLHGDRAARPGGCRRRVALASAARKIPCQSTPWWRKKRSSSVARNAWMSFGGAGRSAPGCAAARRSRRSAGRRGCRRAAAPAAARRARLSTSGSAGFK